MFDLRLQSLKLRNNPSQIRSHGWENPWTLEIETFSESAALRFHVDHMDIEGSLFSLLGLHSYDVFVVYVCVYIYIYIYICVYAYIYVIGLVVCV